MAIDLLDCNFVAVEVEVGRFVKTWQNESSSPAHTTEEPPQSPRAHLTGTTIVEASSEKVINITKVVLRHLLKSLKVRSGQRHQKC